LALKPMGASGWGPAKAWGAWCRADRKRFDCSPRTMAWSPLTATMAASSLSPTGYGSAPPRGWPRTARICPSCPQPSIRPTS